MAETKPLRILLHHVALQIDCMKSKIALAGAVIPLLLLAGCAANMTERGTWTGTGKIVNLYASSGRTVAVLAIDIDPGQIRKTTVDHTPVIIDKDLMPIPPGPYVGKRLRVKGLIYCDHPIDPNNKEMLRAYPPSSHENFDMPGVIKVSQKTIKVLAP